MAAAGGVGLAAPQIGVPKRIIVFKVPGERATAAANDGPLELQVLINPVIEQVVRLAHGPLWLPGRFTSICASRVWTAAGTTPCA